MLEKFARKRLTKGNLTTPQPLPRHAVIGPGESMRRFTGTTR
jgi:hypothetical protein